MRQKTENAGGKGAGRLPSISFSDLSLLARVAALCGFDIESVLTEIGISVSSVQENPEHGELDVITAMMDLGVRRSTRGYFPFLLGEHYGFEHTPEVQTFLATGSSLRKALWLLDFLPYFVHPAMTSKYDIKGDYFTIYFELRDDSGIVSSPGLMETVLVVLNRVLTQLLGQQTPAQITFQHQPMTSMSAYEKQFGSSPTFGGNYDGARHHVALLDHPLPSASPALHARMQLVLEQRLRQLQELDGVENALSNLLRHAPSITIAEASKRMGIEMRTLQRRLKLVGSSFAILRAQSRFHLAKTMLADKELDIDTIALKLGFADRTTFTKAFSKWSDLPPATYRRVHSK